MHLDDLIELAGLVVLQAPAIVRDDGGFPKRSIENYWIASRARDDHWARALKSHLHRSRTGRQLSTDWPAVEAVLAEVLGSEMLTRVWSTVVSAQEQRRAVSEAEPVVRSVMASHLEFRRRALAMLVEGPGVPLSAAIRLNALRRRTERWNDLLLGQIALDGPVSELAIDPERVEQFAADLARTARIRGPYLVAQLIRMGLEGALGGLLRYAPVEPELNNDIAASVLACLPSGWFDSHGLLRSPWITRMESSANDTQGLIEQFFTESDQPLPARMKHDRGTDGRRNRFSF